MLGDEDCLTITADATAWGIHRRSHAVVRRIEGIGCFSSLKIAHLSGERRDTILYLNDGSVGTRFPAIQGEAPPSTMMFVLRIMVRSVLS